MTVNATNTKERLRMFRTSLLTALDKELLDEMDLWVYLAAKIVQLALLVLAFPALLPELRFRSPFLGTI